MGNLAGKVVLISGGGTGLGRAAAVTFAKAGAKVVVFGRRSEKLAAVVAEVHALGGEILSVVADVSKEADVKQVVAETVRAYGRIDLVFNNAAVFEANTVADTTLADWNMQLAINLTGPFLLTRETLPVMRKQNGGKFVNVTTSLVDNGAGGYAAYSASKAGLETLTRTVAEEEAKHHISAVLFNPGTIHTEMHATGRDPLELAEQLLALA
jgi:3-oxoacyl-[acyl-carrier protein] reductase